MTPWVLFPILLTQMNARYATLPSALTAALVAVSVGMSLWQLLLVVTSCAMLGHQMMMFRGAQSFSPIVYRITNPTYPDLGWPMSLVAAAFLYCAIAPAKGASAELE